MIFDWYLIFNLTEFLGLGLVSKTYQYDLEDIGLKDFLVTKGETIGLTYEGVFLSLSINDKNPFIFEGFALFKDDNENVWFGIEVDEN